MTPGTKDPKPLRTGSNLWATAFELQDGHRDELCPCSKRDTAIHPPSEPSRIQENIPAVVRKNSVGC
jgi:hypothetical protein